MLVALVLSVVLAVRVGRRTGSRRAAGAAGLLLAVVSYWVRPDARFVWNEDASFVVLLLATCCARHRLSAFAARRIPRELEG